MVSTRGSNLALPPACACCLAEPASVVVRESGFGVAVLVPYCAECHFHVSAEGTRGLAAALSSSIFGLTLAGVAPLLFPLSLWAYAFVVLAGTALPLILLSRSSRTSSPGHAARGRAVFWCGEDRLACANAEWATRLAAMNDLRLEEEAVRRPGLAISWVGLPAALVAIFFFHPVHYPVVRVVNVTDERLTVLVDGSELVELEPSGEESPGAGMSVRVRAGARRLGARNAGGALIDDRVVQVTGRTEHLYAPASAGRCFWLESDAYGRQAGPEPRGIQPLASSGGFWALPERVDTWFSPNPTSTSDARSSGGRLVALRQARCADSPAEVRAAMDTPVGQERLQAPVSGYSSPP